jgi:hypothetical protein
MTQQCETHLPVGEPREAPSVMPSKSAIVASALAPSPSLSSFGTIASKMEDCFVQRVSIG